MNLKQRLFVTGALRFDDNSAFGQNFNATVYPKASVSWLDLRRAVLSRATRSTPSGCARRFGASGQQPGTTDALRFYNAITGKKDAAATTGVTFGNLGNADLKPERSREFEIGLGRGPLQGPGVGRAHLLQQAHQGRADPARRRAFAGRVRQPSSSTSRASGTVASSCPSTRASSTSPSIAWDLAPERLHHPQQDPRAGRRA